MALRKVDELWNASEYLAASERESVTRAADSASVAAARRTALLVASEAHYKQDGWLKDKEFRKELAIAKRTVAAFAFKKPHFPLLPAVTAGSSGTTVFRHGYVISLGSPTVILSIWVILLTVNCRLRPEVVGAALGEHPISFGRPCASAKDAPSGSPSSDSSRGRPPKR